MLIFCFSYENYLDHLNDDDDHDDHTSTIPQFTQHVEMAMATIEAAAAAVRDATRLEPLVCFYFIFCYNNIFIVPLNTSKWQWQRQLETRHVSSHW